MAITIPVTASVATMSRPAERTGKLHLLVVDEDAAIRSACCEIATDLGFVPQTVSTIAAARTLLRDQGVDVLLLDLRAPLGEGLGLLHEIKALNPGLVVVVMTAYASVPAAVEAMRTGAADYLTKPFAMDELTAVLERALERTNERRTVEGASRQLRETLRSAQGLGNLIGRSPEMDKLYRILSKVAQSSHPVLILGESGVGKELVARSIHSNGPHADRPFVPVDCGSLVPTLMESELFGYVSVWSTCVSLLCASASRTFLFWPATSWSGWRAKRALRTASATMLCAHWSNMNGQGTCASWSIRSIVPAPFLPVPYCIWAICPPSCRTFTCSIAVRWW
jgi:FixJ family two-component response regulator